MTKVSVMITTRNRCADLRRTLEMLRAMTPQPDEILVTADGCSDGTEEMVRRDFPHCKLEVHSPGVGSIPSRDLMIRAIDADIVVSLDDDSYPIATDFFGRIAHVFNEHPEAAVITFPELRDNGSYWPSDKSCDSPGHYVSAYPNGAAAMRRQIYITTGGYPSFFIHSYEEPDYAAQCYEHGHAVWFEPSLIIRHHYSIVNRDELKTHLVNARNELWSVWIRCPWPWLPFVSVFRMFREFLYAQSMGWRWIMKEPRWWLEALRGWRDCCCIRRPIPWQRYMEWMKLARHPIYSLTELNHVFGFGDRS